MHILSVGSSWRWLAWHAFTATRAGAMTVGNFTTIVTLSILVAANIRTLGDNLFTLFEQYGVLNDGIAAHCSTPHEIVDPAGRPCRCRS